MPWTFDIDESCWLSARPQNSAAANLQSQESSGFKASWYIPMTDSHCYVAPRSPYPWMRLVHRALPMLCVCVSSDIHIEKHSFFIPLLIPLFSTPRDLVSWTLITTGGGHASVWPQTYVKHMSRKPLSLSLSLSLSLTHTKITLLRCGRRRAGSTRARQVCHYIPKL